MMPEPQVPGFKSNINIRFPPVGGAARIDTRASPPVENQSSDDRWHRVTAVVSTHGHTNGGGDKEDRTERCADVLDSKGEALTNSSE